MKNLINIVAVPVAMVVFVFGLVTMATPLPGAVFIAAAGLGALVCLSPRAKRCLQYLRTRWPRLDGWVLWIENKMGTRFEFIGQALYQTRPVACEESAKNQE